MKNFFIGLIIGIVLAGVAGYLMLPGIKQTSYESGYDAGNKKGIVTGTNTGIAQGIDQLKALQKHESDSVAMVEKNLEAKRKAARKPKKVEEPTQNWHVYDRKIADPIEAKKD